MDGAPLYAPEGRLLAVDDEKGSLGDLSLQLLRLGVDVLLATEIDEAELLARQEGQRLRGALLSSATDEARIDEVVEAIGPHTGIGPESIALLGRRIDEESMRRLRERGVRWRLWSPYEDRDLRFLGWELLCGNGDQDLRIDRRFPTALPASVERRGESRDVLVGDLSLSGAYLETASPFPAGSQLNLVIALPGSPLDLRCTVRWVSSQKTRVTGRAQGCGVEFLEISGEALAALKEHLETERARFYL